MRERPQVLEQIASKAAGDVVLDKLVAFGQDLSDLRQAVAEVQAFLRGQTVVKEWYSTTELADAMSVSVYTVAERWCNAGRIECEKDPDSGKWRIPGHEFQRLVRGGPLRPRQ